MILVGGVVIPEFDEMLIIVMLLTIGPEKLVFDDKVDDTVVLIVDDRGRKVVFDKLFVFNKLLPVKLINGDTVVLEVL
jgi:hypothetical protein